MGYEPTPPPPSEDITEILDYLYNELQRISETLEEAKEILYLMERHTEPEKPREGMVAFADGSDWDPGAGQGPYMYIGGDWHEIVWL